MTRTPRATGLLCVMNFPSGTGYAWDFIESLYAGVADRLAPLGVRTWVAYPGIQKPPRFLRHSAATPIEHEVRLRQAASVMRTCRLLRRLGVTLIYLSDRPSWHPAYSLFRLAGVRSIVVHDHTSGARTVPRGPKRWLKRARQRLPGTLADRVVGVSDYVARRKIEVDLVPAGRVQRIWNSVPIPSRAPSRSHRLHEAFGIRAQRPVIACACRAAPEKGVHHLLRAFDRLVSVGSGSGRPVLVFIGDGPALDDLGALRATLSARQDIVLTGYREEAGELLGDADLCVVPSVWEEAFGLAALEPMARGVPVIASRVGGIPEVVVDGQTGLLVPPGDEAALERAMRRLLDDPDESRRLGRAGFVRAKTIFSRERELEELTALLGSLLQRPGGNS